MSEPIEREADQYTDKDLEADRFTDRDMTVQPEDDDPESLAGDEGYGLNVNGEVFEAKRNQGGVV